MLEPIASTLLVENLLGDEIFTMGPYENEDEMTFAGMEVLKQLLPEGSHFDKSNIPDSFEDYKECYLLAVNSDGVAAFSVYELDHWE